VGWEGGKREDKTKFEGLQFNADIEFPHFFDLDQLYDLEEDVFEQNNLADDPAHQEKLRALRAELKKLTEPMPRPFAVERG
jgi:arylsulfatase A-like enzyme